MRQTHFGTAPVKIVGKGSVKSTGIKHYSVRVKTPEGILQEVEEVHHRTKFYALASGGKDSVSICHWLAGREKLEAVVHIKTNIGIRATTDFMTDLCNDMGWPLHVIEPSPKHTYASHVLSYGFPGPGFHNRIMGKLKYKTMRDFALTIDKKHHCLISGVRKYESDRRNANYPEPIQSDGNLWFASPFFYRTSEEVYNYVHVNGLRITPVHDVLGMSGECMCGAFAGRGEKKLIRELDGGLADYIDWLEDGVQRFGTAQAKKYPKWGESARMSELDQQIQITEFIRENPDLNDADMFEGQICGQECGPGTLRGAAGY